MTSIFGPSESLNSLKPHFLTLFEVLQTVLISFSHVNAQLMAVEGGSW
jgi:hypothetical protein